mgnify:FL=1|jgi:hypothetical protein|tara:strand:- start:1090 stop:1662 length:573 start_codon:yes stop_codon:yes gene_type:complete
MALWGNDIKPKNLTDAEKKEVYATPSGWVRESGSILSGNGNTSATPEVLVAIGGLNVNMGTANITDLEFVNTVYDKSAGFTMSVLARFNEAVTVTGTPQLSVTNGNQGTGTGRGPHVLSYASGTGTNELSFTLVIAAANAATAVGDIMVIGANAMALNGGTVKDLGTTTVSTITSAAGIGTAAGSVTVVT